MESNQDPDFQENEDIYDELGDLDEIQQLQINAAMTTDHIDDSRSTGTPLAHSNSHTSGHSGSTSPPSGSGHQMPLASHLISPSPGSNHSRGGDDSTTTTTTTSSSRKQRNKSESHAEDARSVMTSIAFTCLLFCDTANAIDAV